MAAVALYDIGEFVKSYPGGRSVAKRLGARDVVMKLIDHENPELQRQALQCISKMLVQNWQVSLTVKIQYIHEFTPVNVSTSFP